MRKPRKKSPKLPEQIRIVSDDYGNNLKCFNNGKRIRLYLKLVSENKSRRIGVINPKQKILEIKRNRSRHLFRKNESYGFNHKLLADSKLFTNVRISDEHEEWLVPKEHILTHGSFMNFVNHGGFELQIFLPLEKMKEFKKQPKI